MKIFANKSKVHKIIIVILVVMLFNFSAPKPVQADGIGGVLLDPVFFLTTTIVDSIYNGVQAFMLGADWKSTFMVKPEQGLQDGNTQYETTENKEELDGGIWGLGRGDYKVPIVKYSPEEIFANRIPLLDINFLNPSVEGGTGTNVARELRPTIASWYVAIRTLAIVALMSVLIYIGIRMVISSLAADKAKYKKMFMDWLTALCLLFFLHLIMSLALTSSEVITSMIRPGEGGAIRVNVDDGTSFTTNLIGLIRFRVQYSDTMSKFLYLVLYIALITYTLKFTWVYVKRVVNMAFLTLIAPLVALTYPIDKVSDGKAQAFDMWLKEYCFNALLQPFHLLIYIVLVGSAIQVAAENPIYAIVALAFMSPAEKLLRKMFGFEKASGGTIGSLGAVAGGAIAANAVKHIASASKGVGKNNKIRTKDSTTGQRVGADENGNKGLKGFKDSMGAMKEEPVLEEVEALKSSEEGQPKGNHSPSMSQDEGGGRNYNQFVDNTNDEQLFGGYSGKNVTDSGIILPDRLNQQRSNQIPKTSPETPIERVAKVSQEQQEEWKKGNSAYDPDTPFWRVMGDDIRGAKGKIGRGVKSIAHTAFTKDGHRNLIGGVKSVGKSAIRGANRSINGMWKSAPTLGYKAMRGTAKLAARGALAAGAGAVALGTAMTSGDGDKAVQLATGAALAGASIGGRAFEATAGKIFEPKNLRESYAEGKYGDVRTAVNQKADNEYFKSKEFKNHMEIYYGGESKEEKRKIKEAYRSYRKAGITDESEIRKGLKLEKKVKGAYTREEIQNTIQMSKKIETKAFTDQKVYDAEQNRIANLLGGNSKQAQTQAARVMESIRAYRDID
ncbi:MAG: hypothetical protein HFJ53_05365 [Clostridia bacterium]|nr:hypothetical protein [Clostridia bacterium]